jgi:hypothetical protein
MFTNISWVNYIVVVALLLVSWYLFVGFRFYFDDVKEIVMGKRKLQFRGLKDFNYSDPQSELNYQDSTEGTSFQSEFALSDNTFEEVENLVERLKNVVVDAAQRKLLKQEFIDYLRLILSEYPNVKNSPFSSSVSELIASECDKLVSITLTQDEAERLWD